jgi:hypothetical protein
LLSPLRPQAGHLRKGAAEIFCMTSV